MSLSFHFSSPWYSPCITTPIPEFIRPLTVLCGKNGSGKSTLINALSLLRSSLRADRLPYAFDTSDLNPDDIRITNAFYFLASAEQHARFDSPEDELSYGPPGTIGLIIKVNRDFMLPAVPSTEDDGLRIPDYISSFDQFFWKGRCERGMEFRLRIAHPGHCEDSAQTPSLIDLIELQINNCDTIRLEGRRDPLQQLSTGSRTPRRVFPYRFLCSGSYLPTKFRKPVSLIEVGELFDVVNRKWRIAIDGFKADDATQLLEFFEARFCQLMQVALDGCFSVGAIRNVHDYLALEEKSEDEIKTISSQRHVGNNGEHAWFLERAFSGNLMRSQVASEFNAKQMEWNCYRILDHFQLPEPNHWRDAIREHAPQEIYDAVTTISPHDENTEHVCDLLASLFNSLLDCRDLFDRSIWERHFQQTGDDDAEIRYLAGQGVENLDPKELRQLNYLLVRDLFVISHEYGYQVALIQETSTYPFVSHVQVRLISHQLTQRIPIQAQSLQHRRKIFKRLATPARSNLTC